MPPVVHLVLVWSLSLAAPAPNVAQAKWQEIGKTSVGNPVYVDPKSVKKGADGIVTATVRVTFVKPVSTPKGPITASRTVAMFDCGKKVVAVKENTYYHDEKIEQRLPALRREDRATGPPSRGRCPTWQWRTV